MKAFCIGFILVLFTTSNFSQETKKLKEVGLTFYNFESYGIMFKIGKEDRLWRFRTLNLNSNISNNGDNNISQYSFSLSAGRERRKSVSEKINFVYGIELTGGMGQTKNYSNTNSNPVTFKSKHYSFGLTAVIGMQFIPRENWFISAEILPIAQYITEQRTTTFHNGDPPFTVGFGSSERFNFGLNNSSALISIGLRF